MDSKMVKQDNNTRQTYCRHQTSVRMRERLIRSSPSLCVVLLQKTTTTTFKSRSPESALPAHYQQQGNNRNDVQEKKPTSIESIIHSCKHQTLNEQDNGRNCERWHTHKQKQTSKPTTQPAQCLVPTDHTLVWIVCFTLFLRIVTLPDRSSSVTVDCRCPRP